jgi:hypothetical protein
VLALEVHDLGDERGALGEHAHEVAIDGVEPVADRGEFGMVDARHAAQLTTARADKPSTGAAPPVTIVR